MLAAITLPDRVGWTIALLFIAWVAIMTFIAIHDSRKQRRENEAALLRYESACGPSKQSAREVL